MAYAATTTVQQIQRDPEGKGLYVITIAETGAGSTDETSFEVPKAGRVLRQTCTASTGNVTPALSIATGTATVNKVYTSGTTSTSVNNEPNDGAGAAYYSSNGKLYHRSAPSSADVTITTIYLIQGSW